MKKLFTLLSLLYISSIAFSQYVNYEDDNGWKLGFNFGGTWQEKEPFYSLTDTVYSKPYGGFSGGFTLGKAIYEEEGKFFSVDLRFRYLKGKNYGWTALADSFAHPYRVYGMPFGNEDSVYAYHNYKMALNEFDLEGVLTLNRLRENTGIILYGFGGIGLNYYNVRRDVVNGAVSIIDDGTPYDYSSLSVNGSDEQIGRELRHLSDLDFESEVSGKKFKFMPSLGLGIGYQFTPQFSMGLEHKITYALNNDINNSGIEHDQRNDRYHYTAFNFKFNLFSDATNEDNSSYQSNHNDYSSTQQTTATQQTTNNTQNNNTPYGTKPLVNITNPNNRFFNRDIMNSIIINTNTFNFKAILHYVKAKEDIIIKQNGYQISNFTYNLNTNTIEAPLNLAPGKHILEITVKNDYGSDYDKAEIVYKLKAPIVNITSPNVNPKNTNNGNASIIAMVYNIHSKQDIRLTINGYEVPNFTYNINTNELLLNTTLIKGSNVILIHAQNQIGSASDNTTIIYAPIVQCDKPVITYISPINGSTNSNSNTYNMKVKIAGVLSVNDINIKKEEIIVPFQTSYNTNTGELASILTLKSGLNTFVISANNTCGETTINISITYTPIVPCNKPTINLNSPNSASYTTNNSKGYIEMKLTDAKSFEYKIEGQNSSAYEYSSTTGIFKSMLHLKRGINNFELTAINDCGITNQKITINYENQVPCDKPIITYISPANGSANSNSNTYNVKVKITGILSANDINIKKDGLLNKIIKNYNTNTGELSATLNLEPGPNTFVISANNACGKTTRNISITYTPIAPCNKPTISLNAPNSASYTTNNSKGYIEMKLTDAKSFEYKIEGQNSSAYEYSSTTGIFKSMLHLKRGINNFELTAINDCGITNQKITINYENQVPCDKPIITYIFPANGSANSNSNTYNMKVKITGVLSVNDINIKKGKIIVPFQTSYNTNTGELTSTLTLKSGLNTFVINANNVCGKTTRNISITYTPIEPPKIILSSPSSFPHQTSNQQIDIIGKVLNVKLKSDIDVLIDGTPTSFTFNTATRQIKIPLNLNIGNNILKIEANNTAGNDKEIVNIIRTGPPPVIHLKNRSENTSLNNPEIINVATFSVIGYVSEFDSVSFEVKDLNGSSNINYNYSTLNGEFRMVININNNQLINLEMKASNNFGTDIMNLYLLRGVVSNSMNNSNSNGNNNGKTINTNTGQSKTDYNKIIQKADMYYNARKWEEAKSYYQKALIYNPKDSYAKGRITTLNNKINNANPSKTNNKESNSSTKTKSSSNSETENKNRDAKNTKSSTTKSSKNNSKTSETNTSTNKAAESKVKTTEVNKTEDDEDKKKTKIKN